MVVLRNIIRVLVNAIFKTTVKVAADWASDSASDWAVYSTVFNRPKVEYLKPFFQLFLGVFVYESAVTRAIQRTCPVLGKKLGKQAYFWEKFNI